MNFKVSDWLNKKYGKSAMIIPYMDDLGRVNMVLRIYDMNENLTAINNSMFLDLHSPDVFPGGETVELAFNIMRINKDTFDSDGKLISHGFGLSPLMFDELAFQMINLNASLWFGFKDENTIFCTVFIKEYGLAPNVEEAELGNFFEISNFNPKIDAKFGSTQESIDSAKNKILRPFLEDVELVHTKDGDYVELEGKKVIKKVELKEKTVFGYKMSAVAKHNLGYLGKSVNQQKNSNYLFNKYFSSDNSGTSEANNSKGNDKKPPEPNE